MTELTARYPHRLPWFRSTRRASPSPKTWLISALGGAPARAMAVAQGFACSGRLLGSYNFRGGEVRYRALLTRWLASARDGDLLMCHAGLDSPADDALAAGREAEYAVLADAGLPRLLQAHGITLWPMSRILNRGIE